MLKINLILFCVIWSFIASASASNFSLNSSIDLGELEPCKRTLELQETDKNTKNKKLKISREIEQEKLPQEIYENKIEIKSNFEILIENFLQVDPVVEFNNIIKSDIDNNISVARNYAEKTLSTVEKYLKSLTTFGIKYFSYEDLTEPRKLERQEILLRKKRTSLYKSMYKSAEDLYFMEENDPQAIEIAILFYLEEAYTAEQSKKGDFLHEAVRLYCNFQYKENKKFKGNGLNIKIGRNSILERAANNAAVTVLSFHEKFGAVFKNIKTEIDFDAMRLFMEKYEEFVKPFGKDFNPFYGYPKKK